MPGFTAEVSLAMGRHELRDAAQIRSIRGVAEVRPQMMLAAAALPQRGFGGDPDLGSYFRCKAAGGPELICRFFAGLPPFTIGGVLF